MRKSGWIVLAGGLLLALPFAMAQRPPGPGGPPGGGFGESLSKSADVEDLVTRMMAFDADKDGKLTRGEVADSRLLGLFGRADANKDGTVTKEELTTLAEKEYIDGGSGGPGGFGPPPGGPGGPGGFGPPPGGPGGGGRPGEVLSSMVQQRLELSDDQKTQVASLQAEVDARLAKILNDDQKAQLKQMRERGPGGPGGPRRGGPGGPGGPGGGPGGPPRN